MNNISKEFILIETKDGSHTLYSSRYKSHFHSIHGAFTESNHIFIQIGLYDILKNKNKIKILEVGFGTGINCLLTWDFFLSNPQFHCDYYAIDKNPTPPTIIEKLNINQFSKNLNKVSLSRLHYSEWGVKNQLEKNFFFSVFESDLLTFQIPSEIDLVFFDAFAPDCQPELWTIEVFKKLINNMNPGGILVTYCAKGYVKRNLKSAGFIVQSLPGPPGKREVTKAIVPI